MAAALAMFEDNYYRYLNIGLKIADLDRH